jgi:hypothetical protein
VWWCARFICGINFDGFIRPANASFEEAFHTGILGSVLERTLQVSASASGALREPVTVIHLYNFYALLIVVLAHVIAVVLTELREGGGIITAMVTGRMVLAVTPLDQLDVDKP